MWWNEYEVTDLRNSLLHLDAKILVIADIAELTKPTGDAGQCYETGTTEAQDQLGGFNCNQDCYFYFLSHAQQSPIDLTTLPCQIFWNPQ